MLAENCDTRRSKKCCVKTNKECKEAQAAVKMLHYLRGELPEVDKERAELLINDLISVIGCCKYINVRARKDQVVNDDRTVA